MPQFSEPLKVGLADHQVDEMLLLLALRYSTIFRLYNHRVAVERKLSRRSIEFEVISPQFHGVAIVPITRLNARANIQGIDSMIFPNEAVLYLGDFLIGNWGRRIQLLLSEFMSMTLIHRGRTLAAVERASQMDLI